MLGRILNWDDFKEPRDSMTPDELDDFLWFLAESGDWHSLSEVAGAMGLPEERVEMAASLLDEFDLVSFDREKRLVSIHPRVRRLYAEEPQGVP